MAIPIYDATTKAARMTATRNAVAGGDLQILAANDDVLVTFPLSASGGTIDVGAWTVTFGAGSDTTIMVQATGGGAGTNAAKARLRDSGEVVRISGLTVGVNGSGAGVIIDNVSIAEGQNVTCGSAVFNHAPDPE
jgi:hypothetical protein